MIQLENICKQYTNHNHTVRAVDDVSFSVAENERVGIAGGSGSGKSTLLRIIALLEKPTSGTLRLFGEDIHSIQNHYRNISLYADDVPKSLGGDSTEDELRIISLRAVYQLWAYGCGVSKGRYP